jgi:hypothetical protein
MVVLNKDALVKLLGDELYGIELDYAMLRDIERRAIERRGPSISLDVFARLTDTIDAKCRREPKTGLRDFFFARMKYVIGILTPTLSWPSFLKSFVLDSSCIPARFQLYYMLISETKGVPHTRREIPHEPYRFQAQEDSRHD